MVTTPWLPLNLQLTCHDLEAKLGPLLHTTHKASQHLPHGSMAVPIAKRGKPDCVKLVNIAEAESSC